MCVESSFSIATPPVAVEALRLSRQPARCSSTCMSKNSERQTRRWLSPATDY